MELAAAALETVATAASTVIAGAPAALGAPAIPSLFSAAGVASAATAAGSSLMSALGSTSTLSSILSGGATIASVLNAQRAGEDKAFGLNLQADDADLSARVEAVQGLQRRTSLKASLVQAVGDRDVAAAASGIDLSFGTPTIARGEAIRDGERAVADDQETENFRKSRLAEKASNLRIMAGQARAGGLGNAAALALQGGASLLKRG